MKALVTGAAGFIGAHVYREARKQGMDVLALDDLSGGFRSNLPDDAAFVEGSVTDVELLDRLFEQHRFDYVYHLAAYAAEGLSHFIRRFNYETNLIGSINLINLAVRHEVKCFVFTSSIAVYGSNQVPMTEETVPRPEDPYGISKYAVELDLAAAHHLFGLNYVVFRPHNVYGELQNIGDKYRNVIGIFMNHALQGQSFPVFGDGMQTRAFTYVGDIAPIIAAAALHKECWQEVFNVGSDKSYTVKRLAEVVAEALGVPCEVRHLRERKEVVHAYASHEKLARSFPGLPSTGIEEGVRRMAAWVRTVGARTSKDFGNIEIRQGLPEGW
jgi:UDP-glucose 4-epimerase